MIETYDAIGKRKHLSETEQFEFAEKLYSEHCYQSPDNSEAWFSLGVCRHQLNKIESAIKAFDRAVLVDQENIAALNAKANMLADLGREEEALEVTRQALKVAPTNVTALLNQASLLFLGAYYSEALVSLNLVLELEPSSTTGLKNRSIIHTRLGDLHAALADAEQLVKLDPNLDAYLLQSAALIAMKQFEEAEQSIEKVLLHDQRNLQAWILLAMIKAGLENFDEADKFFLLAEAEDAKQLGVFLAGDELHLPAELLSDPMSLYLSLSKKRLKNCQWKQYSDYLSVLQTYLMEVDDLSFETAVSLLQASFYADIDPAIRLELAKYIASEASDRRQKFEHVSKANPERLKIAYLAKSFNEGARSQNTAEIYALHNRHDFEIYCLSIEPSDDSAINQQVKNGCDHFIELYPRSSNEIAELLHQEELHILVDLDGVSTNYPYDLLTRQLAPIQIGYGGMPFSSGVQEIQYRLTDRRACPFEQEEQWTEKLIFLPNTQHVYHQAQVSEQQSDKTRKKLGLPKKAMVLCCFVEPECIEPEVFSCWMKILKLIPGSVLWLEGAGTKVQNNLRKEARRKDIRRSRLVFAGAHSSRADQMERYKYADLFLDTFINNADQTVSDALWSGLPVLSKYGSTMASRLTASKLSVLDFPTLICSSEEEYIQRAVYLSTHPEYLNILKRKVERQVLSKPLFKMQQTMLNLEKAYREVWRRYAEGQSAESFFVEES